MQNPIPMYICAVHSFGLGIFHLTFWKIFHWKKELATCSVSVRAIVQIANIRLIYLFFLVGVLCLTFPDELTNTPLGRALMIGISLFWLGRTVEQFIFLRYNRLLIHTLTIVFIFGFLAFAYPVFQSFGS